MYGRGFLNSGSTPASTLVNLGRRTRVFHFFFYKSFNFGTLLGGSLEDIYRVIFVTGAPLNVLSTEKLI